MSFKNEAELKMYRDRAELMKSPAYKDIRDIQIEKVIELSTSNIEPSELKGMLRLISYTDSWQTAYTEKINN